MHAVLRQASKTQIIAPTGGCAARSAGQQASDMRLIIVSGLFAIVLPFAIGLFATKKRVGLDVSERFLERLDEIPSGATEQQRELSSGNLKNWVADHPVSAAQYARYVIPMDILYLLALGSFLGLASNWLAADMQWPASFAGVPIWIWLWLLPALYIVADIIEDSMIAVLMTSPRLIEPVTVRALTRIKGIKISSVGAAMLQTAVLGVLTLLWSKGA
ncbi:MAG: hypothetical protein ABIL01_28165 [Pseudomonadota bacterium]